MSDSSGTTSPDSGFPRGLAWVLGISLVLKLIVLAIVGDVAAVLDETQYVHAGRSVAAGEGIQYTYERWHPLHQGPLYPYFLALVFKLGGGVMASKVIQALLSTVTAWAVYALGRRAFGHRSGFVAATIVAFYPTLIAFTHYNWSETFYVFWFALAFLALFDRDGGLATPRQQLLAGVLFGLAALSRAVVAYAIVPLMVAFFLLREREEGSLTRATKQGAALLLGFGLAVAPQATSIYREYGEFALISSSSARVWHEVYNGYPPRNSDHGFPPRLQARGATIRPAVDEPNPIRRARAETRAGLQFLFDNPGLCLRRFVTRVTYFVNPTSFLIRHIRRGYYLEGSDGTRSEPAPTAVREGVVVLTLGSYILLAGLALVGFFTMPRGPARSLLLGTFLFFVVLHGLTFGMSRYRLLVVPLLAVVAGYVVAEPRAVLARLRSPARTIPCALLFLGLVYAWSLYWSKLWVSPT